MTALQPYRGSALTPPFDRASVADVMRPGIFSCHGDASLRELADTMATHRIHAVVVAGTRTDPVHGEELVWGLVTDLDLVRAAAGPPDTRAGDIARTEAVTIGPTTPLPEVARIMAERELTHLIVAQGSQPIGVVSALDLAGVIAWGGGPAASAP